MSTASIFPPPSTTRLTEEVAEWMYGAVEAHRQGEDARWDVWVAIMPTPQGATPMMCFLLTLPGIVVGDRSYTVSMSQTLSLSREDVDNVVRTAFEGLRTERSKALSQMTNSQPNTPKLHLA